MIRVKNKSKKVIASAKADAKGTFSVKIKKQKAGTVLYVTAADTDKKESKEAHHYSSEGTGDRFEWTASNGKRSIMYSAVQRGRK